MNNELNINAENQLMHFGIKGQKWGLRRFQNKDGTLTPQGRQRYAAFEKDVKTAKKLNTRTAAAEKNLRQKHKVYKQTEAATKVVEKEYNKIANKLFMKRETRNQLLMEKGEELKRSNDLFKKTLEDLNRAERVYDSTFKKFDEQVKKMQKEYTEVDVLDIPTTSLKLGSNYTKTIAKTGLTVADMPLIGGAYTNWYSNKATMEDYRKTVV